MLNNNKMANENNLQQSKMRRLKVSMNHDYLFNQLFVNKKQSDISIVALEKTWKLHKIIICQSPYFESLLSDSWIEANDDVIDIKIPDDNVTVESLEVVLSSLYKGEIDIDPQNVVSILATARLFQLEEIIKRCIEIMGENINSETVICYRNAELSYGISNNIKTATKRWLETNLMTWQKENHALLKQITPELMTELISSPSLLILESEYHIYSLLKLWIFLFMEKECSSTTSFNDFFENRDKKIPLLNTPEGFKYKQPFLRLKLEHLLLSRSSKIIVEEDNLLPKDWIKKAADKLEKYVVRINSHGDKGPVKMSEEKFEKECMRFGWLLEPNDSINCRVSSINSLFGLHLQYRVNKEAFFVKRLSSYPCGVFNVNPGSHNIMLKVLLLSFDDNEKVTYTRDSGMRFLSLVQDQTIPVMSLKTGVKFPLFISIKIQVVSPL